MIPQIGGHSFLITITFIVLLAVTIQPSFASKLKVCVCLRKILSKKVIFQTALLIFSIKAANFYNFAFTYFTKMHLLAEMPLTVEISLMAEMPLMAEIHTTSFSTNG